MGQAPFIPEERMRLGGCGQSLPEGPRGQRAEQVPYPLMDSSAARGSSDLGDGDGTQGTPLLGARVPHPGRGPLGERRCHCLVLLLRASGRLAGPGASPRPGSIDPRVGREPGHTGTRAVGGREVEGDVIIW